jgi:chorismate mutase/prephenate dehydratase
MSELDVMRGAIDEIDNQIVHLFQRRMAVTQQVGEFKQRNQMPVLDNLRQKEVLESKAALTADPALKADVTLLYETIMGISRRQQRKIVREGAAEPNFARIQAALAGKRQPVENPLVVYQGEPGAYSEQASFNFFGPEVRAKGLHQFEDVFLALENGQADYGVVPIENNSTGAIRQIYDLLSKYEFSLVGETTVKVEHCLAAPQGADFSTITHVYSHEQGIFQSEEFLKQYPTWVPVSAMDTAGSAKFVAETGDPTKAAICSKWAAKLYGLNILAEKINFNAVNTTRFVVVSPKMELRPGADKVSAVLTTPHESGCLHEILGIFAVNGLNMVKLESRPIPGKSWEYMFFIEFTGDLTAPGMLDVLREIAQTAADFRVLGNFKANLETRP